jgi:hypothetical protein
MGVGKVALFAIVHMEGLLRGVTDYFVTQYSAFLAGISATLMRYNVNKTRPI